MSKKLTRGEAAEFLTDQGYRTKKSTLAKLACVGGGPPYDIFGNKALYTTEGCIGWAEGRLIARTRAPPKAKSGASVIDDK